MSTRLSFVHRAVTEALTDAGFRPSSASWELFGRDAQHVQDKHFALGFPNDVYRKDRQREISRDSALNVKLGWTIRADAQVPDTLAALDGHEDALTAILTSDRTSGWHVKVDRSTRRTLGDGTALVAELQLQITTIHP